MAPLATATGADAAVITRASALSCSMRAVCGVLAGAIVVLFLFVIMLAQQAGVGEGRRDRAALARLQGVVGVIHPQARRRGEPVAGGAARGDDPPNVPRTMNENLRSFMKYDRGAVRPSSVYC